MPGIAPPSPLFRRGCETDEGVWAFTVAYACVAEVTAEPAGSFREFAARRCYVIALVDFRPSKPFWLQFFPGLKITRPDITAFADIQGLGEPQLRIANPALDCPDMNAVPGGEVAHGYSVVVAYHGVLSFLQQCCAVRPLRVEYRAMVRTLLRLSYRYEKAH